MKKNTLYIITGFLGLILLGLFGISVAITNPIPAAAGFIGCLIIFLIARRHIDGILRDERQVLIDMHASVVTIRTAAVMFITVNLATAVYVFSGALGINHAPHIAMTYPAKSLGAYPPFIHAPPSEIPLSDLGTFAVIQLILIIATLFIYAGSRAYYTRKYGGLDSEDEE